ncbi:hypothetical protein FRC01_011601, partial [Tulasnella sp. 417]
MRLNAVFFVLATSLASTSAIVTRADASDFPSCSLPCFTNAENGDCSAADNACLCTNNAFLRSTTDCNEASCSPEDLEATAVVARALCSSVGVDIRTNPNAQPTGATSTAKPTAAVSSNAAPTGSMIDRGVLLSAFAAAAVALT